MGRGQSGRSSSQGRSYTRPRTTSKFPVKPYPPPTYTNTPYGTIEHLLHRKRNFHRDSVPSPRLRNHQKELNSSESHQPEIELKKVDFTCCFKNPGKSDK